MKTIVIATKNAGKAREYQEMLAPLGIEVKTLADFAPIAINENGLKKMQQLKPLQLLINSNYQLWRMIRD